MDEATAQRKFIKEFKEKHPNIVVSHNIGGANVGGDNRKGRLIKLSQTHDCFPDLTFNRPNLIYPVFYIEFKLSRKHYEKLNNKRLRCQKDMLINLRKNGYYTDFAGYEEIWDLVKWFYDPNFLHKNKYSLTPYWSGSVLKTEGLI